MPDDLDGDDLAQDLALGSFRLVKEKLDFELDFTPETLPVVDHYLLSLREEDGGRPDEKVVSVVAPCVGAYFGEVVRRSLPGTRWHVVKDDYRRWRIEGAESFVCFNPIGVALEALHREALPGWEAHLTLLADQREAVERSLAASGAVREDDFFRLAVRHEVLEQTLSVLEQIARQTGVPRAFGPDASAAVVDDAPSDIEA